MELLNIWSAVCEREEREGAKGGEMEITREWSAVSRGGEHMWVYCISVSF